MARRRRHQDNAKKKGGLGIDPTMLLLLAGGGLALYFFMSKKPAVGAQMVALPQAKPGTSTVQQAIEIGTKVAVDAIKQATATGSPSTQEAWKDSLQVSI